MKTVICTLLLLGLSYGDVSHLKHNEDNNGYLPPDRGSSISLAAGHSNHLDTPNFQPYPGQVVNYKGMTIQRSQEIHLGSFMEHPKETLAVPKSHPTHTLAIPKVNKPEVLPIPESFKGDGYLPPSEEIIPEPEHPNPVVPTQKIVMPMPSWFRNEIVRNKIALNEGMSSSGIKTSLPSNNDYLPPTSSGSSVFQTQPSFTSPSAPGNPSGSEYIPPSAPSSPALVQPQVPVHSFNTRPQVSFSSTGSGSVATEPSSPAFVPPVPVTIMKPVQSFSTRPQVSFTSSGTGSFSSAPSSPAYVPPAPVTIMKPVQSTFNTRPQISFTSSGSGTVSSGPSSSAYIPPQNTHQAPVSQVSFSSGPSSPAYVPPLNTHQAQVSQVSFSSAPSSPAYVPPLTTSQVSSSVSSGPSSSAYVPPLNTHQSPAPQVSFSSSVSSSSPAYVPPPPAKPQISFTSTGSGSVSSAPSSPAFAPQASVKPQTFSSSGSGYIPPSAPATIKESSHSTSSAQAYVPPAPSHIEESTPTKDISSPILHKQQPINLKPSQPFDEIESHEDGYTYEKKTSIPFEEEIKQPIQDQFRTLQIYNKNSKKVSTFKVLEKAEQNGLKTIKILGKTNKTPPQENFLRTVQIVSGKNDEPLQTVKIFNDSHGDNKGYLPPAESYYFK